MKNDPEFEPQEMSQRVKAAVQNVPVPPYLDSKIRNSIRGGQSQSIWRGRMVAVAAVVVICLGVAVAYQWRVTAVSKEPYLLSLSNEVASIMRVGFREHIHCAVFHDYSQDPPKVEQLEAEMGPKYVGLMQIVKDRVPDGYRLMMAHRCSFHGRQYIHLALTNRGKILSLLVSVKGEGESFATDNLVPALTQAGIPVYRSGVQKYQIAAFETRDHLVYVVSDLPQQTNIDMLLALAPGVKEFLNKLES